MTKMLSASGGGCPGPRLAGTLPPDPHYSLVLRTRHGAPPTTDTFRPPMSPTKLCPSTSNRKSAPMLTNTFCKLLVVQMFYRLYSDYKVLHYFMLLVEYRYTFPDLQACRVCLVTASVVGVKYFSLFCSF